MGKRILELFLPIIVSFIPFQMVMSQDNDTWISDTAYEACVEYGEEYGICPELIMAIIERESGGNINAENGDCKGLMQISEKWHKDRMERLGVTDIFDERGNILVGTDYLAELFDEHREAVTVLMVYHGEKNAVNLSKSGYISRYAEDILERSEVLERMHGK